MLQKMLRSMTTRRQNSYAAESGDLRNHIQLLQLGFEVPRRTAAAVTKSLAAVRSAVGLQVES